MGSKEEKVTIVVLGDIGRSPRMQYHASSFIEEGYKVALLGYSGSEPIEKLRDNPNVTFRYIHQCPEFKQYVSLLLAYILKVIWQSLTLFFALLTSQRCDYLLVQNPPSIPTLAVCYMYSVIFRCRFIIDWHNYGHTLLALSVGQNHKLVKISKNFEQFFGRKSHNNICVTKGMKNDLENNHNIKSVVLYDRPPSAFKEITTHDKHELFKTLGHEYELFTKDCTEKETIFTKESENGEIIFKGDRPGILISSTSWTEDEDFSILLNALEEYEKACTLITELPSLVCIITGKGPLKEFYKGIIAKKTWNHVDIITPWLKAEDYPLILASADLGVSLHTSSSGLDLPMKVVDMFGCGVPVCAHNFECISELVKHEENSYVFKDSVELSNQIQNWFREFPTKRHSNYEKFTQELKNFNSLRWHDNWKFNALPLFRSNQN